MKTMPRRGPRCSHPRGRPRVGHRRSTLAYTAVGFGRRAGAGPADKGRTGDGLTFSHETPTSAAMNMPSTCADFEIRFDDLFHCGRWLTFPCDAQGRVDIDALSERSRNNYLYARAMVGREYSMPSLCPHILTA
jgi:hypothetical protein